MRQYVEKPEIFLVLRAVSFQKFAAMRALSAYSMKLSRIHAALYEELPSEGLFSLIERFTASRELTFRMSIGTSLESVLALERTLISRKCSIQT